MYSPVDAPTTVYSAWVGWSEFEVEDHFETDLGWTTVNYAASGQWQRGVPVDDPSWDYDPASDGDGSGQCWLTQNEMGNTDVDDGSVRLISPVFDMSAGGSISYDYYLYLTEPSTDKMQVQVSNAGAAGAWIEVAVHNTDGGLNWRSHEITEAELIAAGVSPTDNMMVRFTVNDSDPQSIVEAGVDNFAVSVKVCEMPAMCGDADGSEAVDIDDVVFLINFIFAGGPEPFPYEAGDVDCSGTIDIDDVVYIIGFIFSGGYAPCDTDGDGEPDC
jgi:hypothetical protein